MLKQTFHSVVYSTPRRKLHKKMTQHTQELILTHLALLAVHGSIATWLATRPTYYYYHGGDFEVGQMSWWFLYMAAADHMLCVLVAVWLPEGRALDTVRAIRWTEYFFSASTMNAQIAMLCQVEHTSLVATTAAFTMIMIAVGALADSLSGRPRIIFSAASWIAFVVAWSSPAIYYFHRVADIPYFVTVIVFLLVCLEALFGAVFHLANARITQERAYAALSFAAKTSLALITYHSASARPSVNP